MWDLVPQFTTRTLISCNLMQADENGRKGSRRPGCGVGRSAALEQLARAKREGRSLLSSYKVKITVYRRLTKARFLKRSMNPSTTPSYKAGLPRQTTL